MAYANKKRVQLLSPNTIVTKERDIYAGAVVSLTKRAIVCEAAVKRGDNTVCLIGISQEEAKKANKGVSIECSDLVRVSTTPLLRGNITDYIDKCTFVNSAGLSSICG